ncbi:MAG: AmmeMemoRadiSam system protein A [Candidatus Nitrosotenuis sp.]|nr:MAG: AmmeMemoRadiSam system protein A [Candidatus Nitrosotenuis sp.]
MHPYVALAKLTIEEYVRTGRVPPSPDPLPENMSKPAGAFVSLKKAGELRGCIGTIEPVRENLALEIIGNAIAASTRDPRFPPVSPEELGSLDISVDVLSPPQPVAGPESLDPKRYGVIVNAGRRRGLLLPDIEGVDTAEEQIAICRRKGAIMPDEKVALQRFTVERYR